MEYSVIDPVVVTLPILLALTSVNQTLPSGPAVMLIAAAPLVGITNSVIVPPVVIFPIR